MSENFPADREMEFRSFGVILEQCLLLKPVNEELLIIYDESFLPYFKEFLRAVECRNILASFFFIPTSYQYTLIKMAEAAGRAVQLPASLSESFMQSHAILNVLNGKLETGSVRSAIIKLGRGNNCRLAHVPGMSTDILEILSVSDISEIHKSCEIIAWALGEAHQAELITRDSTGAEHTLRMDLGGWENEPMMSPGVLFPGSWGNVPPGETFCCPEYAYVEGSVCINGSYHEHVMTTGEDVVLTFREGILTAWDCSRSPYSEQYFSGEKAWAEEHDDPNWNIFAELGIGLNPKISKLSGNSLFDEKAWGTIHIAIGGNTGFGHPVSAKKHSDLIARNPTLRLDGAEVVVDGVPLIGKLLHDREARLWTDESVRPDEHIFLRTDQCHWEDGVLKRMLNRAGRIGYVTMSRQDIEAALAALANELSGYSITTREFIQNHPEFNGFPTGKLLGLLKHYAVLAVN